MSSLKALYRAEVAKRSDEDDRRISRMDRDAPDVLRGREPHVRPRVAAVERAVDAVAPRRALPVVRLSRSHPDDARIARRNRNVADRRGPSVAVEHRRPRRPVVGRAKDAAARGPDEDRSGSGGDRLDVVDAATERGGPDRTPRERRQVLRMQRIGSRRNSDREAGNSELADHRRGSIPRL